MEDLTIKKEIGDALVTIFILNWNRKIETARAIQSAMSQSYSNIEIIVVDNGSEDGSVEFLKQMFPDLNIIKLNKNYGCPGGRNKGIPHCNGEFIFFMDNDGVLHKDAIQKSLDTINSKQDVGIVTGSVRNFNNEQEIDTKLELQKTEVIEVSLFNGGVSLHRKKIYKEVGLYPDDYIYGGEETYLSYRLLDAGYKIMRDEQVILWHKKSKVARNKNDELLQKWGNVFMNAYQLFPIEYFLVYLIYFVIVYPFYALRNGIFFLFIRSLFSYKNRLKNYNRNPVRRSTYWMFKKINL